MRAPPTLTVLSLGGGVQSSVMALMAGEGAFMDKDTLTCDRASGGGTN